METKEYKINANEFAALVDVVLKEDLKEEFSKFISDNKLVEDSKNASKQELNIMQLAQFATRKIRAFETEAKKFVAGKNTDEVEYILSSKDLIIASKTFKSILFPKLDQIMKEELRKSLFAE